MTTAVSRRDAIRRLATGGMAAATAPLWVESLLAEADRHAAHRLAAGAAQAAAWSPKVLNAQQNELVIALSELIIPQTDTPGAKAARVNEYIDQVLATAPAADRDAFLQGLAWVDLRSEAQFSRRFVNAPPEQQISLLTFLSTTTDPLPDDKRGVDFFTALKGMTVTGYYSSEAGLTQEIGDQGPGFHASFEGCTHPEHGA